ncbi:hypothetical protein TGVAND_297492 [Toxoplasma gondii VAND]|uniref:Uncharacterized protein n=1 Tax=Toxoplasma gondii VAND TaxID=933077 RepID=A0A086PKQ0_TOXGO|nr:hypothetical protein TGVAND_297492 [Toxoplasma gondii VAND]
MMGTVFKGARVPTCMDAPSLDTLHLKAEQGEDPRRDEAREMGKNSSHEEAISACVCRSCFAKSSFVSGSHSFFLSPSLSDVSRFLLSLPSSRCSVETARLVPSLFLSFPCRLRLSARTPRDSPPSRSPFETADAQSRARRRKAAASVSGEVAASDALEFLNEEECALEARPIDARDALGLASTRRPCAKQNFSVSLQRTICREHPPGECVQLRGCERLRKRLRVRSEGCQRSLREQQSHSSQETDDSLSNGPQKATRLSAQQGCSGRCLDSLRSGKLCRFPGIKHRS